jgi:hypothetical protein
MRRPHRAKAPARTAQIHFASATMLAPPPPTLLPSVSSLLGYFFAQGSTILSEQTARRNYTDVLQRELPPGIDPHDVSIHNIGALQQLLADWDQLENELAAASVDATKRESEAQDLIIIANSKFEESSARSTPSYPKLNDSRTAP